MIEKRFAYEIYTKSMSQWFKVTNYLNHNHTRSRPPKHVSLARVPNPQDISYPHLIAIWSKNPKNHTSCEPSMFQRRLNHFEIAQFSNYLQLNPKARPVISSSDQKANRSFDAQFFLPNSSNWALVRPRLVFQPGGAANTLIGSTT